MIELIIVMVTIGILSAAILPRMEQDNLGNAAEQIIGHIRYTQHLAMVDDKYIPDPNLNRYSATTTQTNSSTENWFRGMWQFQFHPTKEGYSIYSDHPTDAGVYGNAPDMTSTAYNTSDTIAIDPLTKTALVADFPASQISAVLDSRNLQNDLEDAFGVTSSFENCQYKNTTTIVNQTADHIYFDSLGRPYCSQTVNNNPTFGLMVDTMRFIIIRNNRNINICIEAYSGYTHVCPPL